MTNINSELMKKLIAGWGGDKAALLSAYNDVCRFEDKAFGLVHENLEGIEMVFNYTFSIFPDFKVVYGHHVVTDRYASAEWIYTGSFKGEFEGTHYEGVPVTIEGVSFMELLEGKIIRNSDYWSLTQLVQQLESI